MCCIKSDTLIQQKLYDNPEILIIVINNKIKTQFDFSEIIETRKNKYNLICCVTESEPKNGNSFNIIYISNNIWYIIENNDYKEKKVKSEICSLIKYPCILFYKRGSPIINNSRNNDSLSDISNYNPFYNNKKDDKNTNINISNSIKNPKHNNNNNNKKVNYSNSMKNLNPDYNNNNMLMPTPYNRLNYNQIKYNNMNSKNIKILNNNNQDLKRSYSFKNLNNDNYKKNNINKNFYKYNNAYKNYNNNKIFITNNFYKISYINNNNYNNINNKNPQTPLINNNLPYNNLINNNMNNNINKVMNNNFNQMNNNGKFNNVNNVNLKNGNNNNKIIKINSNNNSNNKINGKSPYNKNKNGNINTLPFNKNIGLIKDKKINDKNITLLFKFSNEKELYLDVKESDSFEEVIKELIYKYDWVKNIKIVNYTFNGKKIDLKKTVKENGLRDNSYIMIN